MTSTLDKISNISRYVDIYNSGMFYVLLKDMEYSDNEIYITGTLLPDGTIRYRNLFVGSEHGVTAGDLKATIAIHNHFSGSERIHKDIIERKVSKEVAEFFYDKSTIFLNPSPHDVVVWCNIYNKENPQIFGIVSDTKYGRALNMFDFKLLNEYDINTIKDVSRKYRNLMDNIDPHDDGAIYELLYRFHNEPVITAMFNISYDLIDL